MLRNATLTTALFVPLSPSKDNSCCALNSLKYAFDCWYWCTDEYFSSGPRRDEISQGPPRWNQPDLLKELDSESQFRSPRLARLVEVGCSFTSFFTEFVSYSTHASMKDILYTWIIHLSLHIIFLSNLRNNSLWKNVLDFFSHLSALFLYFFFVMSFLICFHLNVLSSSLSYCLQWSSFGGAKGLSSAFCHPILRRRRAKQGHAFRHRQQANQCDQDCQEHVCRQGISLPSALCLPTSLSLAKTHNRHPWSLSASSQIMLWHPPSSSLWHERENVMGKTWWYKKKQPKGG